MFGEIKRHPVHLNISKKLKLDLRIRNLLQTWTDDVASNAKYINYSMYQSEFYPTRYPFLVV